VSSSGFPTWIEVLSLSDTGVRVSTFSGQANKWLNSYEEPLPMANSTNNAKTFGGLAINSVGMAFGVVSEDGTPDQLQTWLVGIDLVDWTDKGTVSLNGAWG
jgi:hypothetical protein